MPKYAKSLLGSYAKRMRDIIHEVQANEKDDIVIHKLAEIAADCAWCEREYGMERRKDESLHNQPQVQAL